MVAGRGQAALEFLQANGWAIALVVVVAAALFALGLFDVGNAIGNKPEGFSSVAARGWEMDAAGTFMLKLSNHVGRPINMTGISITVGRASMPIGGMPIVLEAGADTGTLSTAIGAFGAQAAGTEYAAKVHVNYTDLGSGFATETGGTLAGKVT